MKSVLYALVLAVLAPVLVASAETSGGKNPRGPIVVNCPDLSCCPPLEPGQICLYSGPVVTPCTPKPNRSPHC